MQNNTTREFLDFRKKIIEKDFKRMNDMQRLAVFKTEGPLLILAGAGSGKTTVLVSRIANIIKYGNAYHEERVCKAVSESDLELIRDYFDEKIPINYEIEELLSWDCAKPWQILAITFTNKAANELKERLALYLGEDRATDIWAGTFHSICARILRRYGDRIGYTTHFTIYDSDDSKRIMKECQRLLGIDDKTLPHKSILSSISQAKDNLISVKEYEKSAGSDIRLKKYAECYKLYQQLLKSADAMDFDDMIVNTILLLQTDEEVREKYQNQFRYVHVDEYQDTNHAQYVLTSLLAGKYNNICVVGDDDQSIYKFRGATIENIMDFEKNYRNATIIRLEQNYRSTGNILAAANEVIKNNQGRKGKNLWTDAGEGEKLTVFTAGSETDEGMYIADEIETSVARGRRFSDHAILYRTNAQSNPIERAFVRMGVPYKVVGGKRFYERKEVRDVIAYLTLINNPADSVKLKRVINEPKRGIGATTVNAVADIAAGLGVSEFEVMKTASEYDKLKRSAVKLSQFTDMIEELGIKAMTSTLPQIFDDLMQATGYIEYLALDRETYEDRFQNLQELKSNMSRYMEENPESDLVGFLEEVSLLSDIDAYNEQADVAVMMTLHSAKGLEFPVVFISGMEEGIFPGRQAMYDQSEVEEERRLAYVGITRAKEKLYLTNANMRMLFGSTTRNPQSRFVDEIPSEYIEPQPDEPSIYAGNNGGYGSSTYGNCGSRYGSSATSHGGSSYGGSSYGGSSYGGASYNNYEYGSFGSSASASSRGFSGHSAGSGTARGAAQKKPQSAPTQPIASYALGDTVRHKAFGTGVVLSVTPMGNDSLIEIAFDKAGTKKLMANYAKLEKVE